MGPGGIHGRRPAVMGEAVKGTRSSLLGSRLVEARPDRSDRVVADTPMVLA
jgi:hypothetical protein